jgi:transcription elongation factor Elf1
MNEFEFTCLYCNHKWKKNYYFKPNLSDISCPVCQDKKIKIQEVEDKIDYYEQKEE